MEKEITIENQVEEIAIIAQFIEELGMSLHLRFRHNNESQPSY